METDDRIFMMKKNVCFLQGMGMGGPNGQMSGPMGGLGHMPPGNMMGGYQGWGTPPASAGYPGLYLNLNLCSLITNSVLF